MSTFDEQVAKAQRLLQELDHSMALYDSTHGGHSTDLSHSGFSDRSDDRSHTSDNGGSCSGQPNPPPSQAAAENGAEKSTQSESPRAAQRGQQQQQQQQPPPPANGAAAATSPGGASMQDGAPALVMAGEDLDDLM
eukprot:COSAG02_NODE_5585_length_4212_cov_3.607829_2_plen_136_part_00